MEHLDTFLTVLYVMVDDLGKQVLALDMVDNSLSPCERVSGWLFIHIVILQGCFILSLPTSICSELLWATSAKWQSP